MVKVFLSDVLVVAVCLSVTALAMCCVVCLGALLYRCLESSALRKLPVSAACALLVFAFGLMPTVAKRSRTTGIPPVAVVRGGLRSGAPSTDFWLSHIGPSSNSVELGVTWLPEVFTSPPFIEFFVSTNLTAGVWTLLGWAEASVGETNLSVEVEASHLPEGMMPSVAFFKAAAYDGLGTDDEDYDGDGIPNGLELSYGTNPRRADTDGDGILDGDEAWVSVGEPFPELDLSSLTNVLAGTLPYAIFPPSVSVTLPFAVEMAGHASTNAVVNINGMVAFLEEGEEPAVLASFSQYGQPTNLYATAQGVVAAYGYFFLMMGYTGSQLRAGIVQGAQGRWFVAEWRDMQDPVGYANLMLRSATFRLAVSETDPGTFRVQYIDVENIYDPTLALFGAHGFSGTPSFSLSDGVTNGMTVAYHFGMGTDPTKTDTDGDGLPDGWEAAHGMNPLVANTGDPRTDASSDPDFDGLTNMDEMVLGTDPFQPDTDGDGREDGWAAQYGFDPCTHNGQTERTDDDANADSDGDGLTNAEECAWGTNPGSPDSDGDGVIDNAEIAQNSDPADPTDGGRPNSRVAMSFTFGDHSSSHSEKYHLTVSPVLVVGEANPPRTLSWVNAEYGECETRTAMLTPGRSYEVRLAHASTNRPQGPDYDYTLNAVSIPQAVILSDPDSLFGVHLSSSTFTGAGLVANAHVLAPPQITAPQVIGVNNDDDNGNGTPDWLDDGEVAGDDDLVEVTVTARCPTGMAGTLKVLPLVNITGVSVWKDKARTESVFSETVSVSGPEVVTRKYYIEGDSSSVSYMFEKLEASLACGGAAVTNVHRFTVAERIAEPITTQREGGQIVNPCCAIIGVPTPMKVQVLPSNFPDGGIKWKVVSGTGTFTNGGTGRSVSFTAAGLEDSEATLQVDVGDCPGRAPQFTLRETTMHEVKIYPCVIHLEDSEQVSPIDQPYLDSLLAEVNTIYRQTGMHFTYGAQILNVTNTMWARFGLSNLRTAGIIRNIMSGTDGLEVYFIPGEFSETVKVPKKMGEWAPRGIILRNSANAKTFAHEIGHACGLYDIYIDHNDVVPSFLLESVRCEWMNDDWSNGTGCRFYDPFLRQRDLVQRLLMYGNVNESKSDIPRGLVHGLSADGEAAAIKVGRDWMSLSPRSL